MTIGLEKNSGHQCVVHHDTMESRRCRSGSELCFEDGWGALVKADSGEVICLEDFLVRTLAKSEDGTLFVRERRTTKDGTVNEKIWNLTAKIISFEELDVSLPIRPTTVRQTMPLFFMMWPRQGLRFFWEVALVEPERVFSWSHVWIRWLRIR